MNRPLSLAVNDFSRGLEFCINESGLPPVLAEAVLKGYYLQVKELAEKQIKEERKAFKNAQEVTEDGK